VVQGIDWQGNLVAGATIYVTSAAVVPPLPRVRINEWMASNGRTLVDPADLPNLRYQDWFELYNAGSATVDLSGYTLSDQRENLALSTIPPGTTIAPGGFLLVWADEEPWQNSPGGNLHVDFKLDVDGDSIFLADPDGRVVDEVTFGRQNRDVSQGRWPDGYLGVSHFMTIATPVDHNRLDLTEALQAVVSNIDTAGVTVAWNTEPGRTYRVLFKENLVDPLWQELGPVTATSFTTFLVDASALGSQRFYRILQD
jgi:hypothetical protein